MTWNPGDAAAKSPGWDPAQGEGFVLPAPPGDVAPGRVSPGAPYMPSATPTVAEVMGWQMEDELPSLVPPEMQRALEMEGIMPEATWGRWKSFLLRGHYE